MKHLDEALGIVDYIDDILEPILDLPYQDEMSVSDAVFARIEMEDKLKGKFSGIKNVYSDELDKLYPSSYEQSNDIIVQDLLSKKKKIEDTLWLLKKTPTPKEKLEHIMTEGEVPEYLNSRDNQYRLQVMKYIADAINEFNDNHKQSTLRLTAYNMGNMYVYIIKSVNQMIQVPEVKFTYSIASKNAIADTSKLISLDVTGDILERLRSSDSKIRRSVSNINAMLEEIETLKAKRLITNKSKDKRDLRIKYLENNLVSYKQTLVMEYSFYSHFKGLLMEYKDVGVKDTYSRAKSDLAEIISFMNDNLGFNILFKDE